MEPLLGKYLEGVFVIDWEVVGMELEWVTDRYPSQYKRLLLFDLIDGVHLGFYDVVTDTFFTLNSCQLNHVAGWLEVPNTPITAKTIKENIYDYSLSMRVRGQKKDSD